MMKKLTVLATACILMNTASSATNNKIDLSEQEFNLEATTCLALNIYHESRNEPLAGKIAVADVTLNRMYDTRYPNTICGVVRQSKLSKWHLERGREVPLRHKCQFSWFCDGRDDEPRDEDFI